MSETSAEKDAGFRTSDRERLDRVRRFADSKALAARALGHDDRAWLDLLILCDGGSDA